MRKVVVHALAACLFTAFLSACQTSDKTGGEDVPPPSQGADSAPEKPPKKDTMQHKALTIPGDKINDCDMTAEAVFLSSDIVKSLLKQPYTAYHMEYKPGDAGNPSKRYRFWVFASPPGTGKSETYGRYEVDPKTGQLYEYNPIEDKSLPIAYNKDKGDKMKSCSK